MRFAIEYQRLLETLCDNSLPLDGTHRQHNLLADCPRGGHRDDTVTDRGLRVVLSLVWISVSIFDTPILSLGDGDVTLETYIAICLSILSYNVKPARLLVHTIG